nr:MAG TPA: hypothetical protein [Caudoviricetes sp.]
MGCTKCGSDLQAISLVVKNLIREMIEDGRLQEGLVDCTDKRLWRETRVLTCDLVGEAVCQLIKNGDICIASPQALTVEKTNTGAHKISLLMSDGTVLETTAFLSDGVLNSVAYSAKTKVATFTTTQGEKYEIDLKDDFDAVTYKFERKDDDSVEITNGKGTTVATIPAIKVKATKKADGNVVITNQDGSEVEIDIKSLKDEIEELRAMIKPHNADVQLVDGVGVSLSTFAHSETTKS